MIKSLIILALLVVIMAAAFLSRPKPADFKPFIQQKIQASQGKGNIIKDIAADWETDNYLKQCTIKDRLLWVTVQKDGQTAYVGAFSHWFEASGAKKQPA